MNIAIIFYACEQRCLLLPCSQSVWSRSRHSSSFVRRSTCRASKLRTRHANERKGSNASKTSSGQARYSKRHTTESTLGELESAVGRQAELLTSELSCLQAGTCSLDTPRLSGCQPRDRKRRRRAAPPSIDLLVTMTYRLRHHGDVTNYRLTGMCTAFHTTVVLFVQ